MLSDPAKVLAQKRKAVALLATKRASMRAAASVSLDLKRGLNSLATIMSLAPLIGLSGTIAGAVGSFGGVGASKESILVMIFEGLSRAFVPCALGLIVALVAMWFYRFLLAEIESLEL